MHPSSILKQVRLTEKANKLSSAYGQYTFEVARDANKHAIARAVEATFKVTVTRVNVQNVAGKAKRGRTGQSTHNSDFKKAVVTLKSGDKIELV